MSLISKAVSGRCRRFLRDSRGNIAVIFAFSFFPIIMACGAALDYGHGNAVRVRIQAALDATGLMLAHNVGHMTTDDLVLLAEEFFAENFVPEPGVRFAPLETQVQANVITIAAAADVDTYLMQLAGIPFLQVGASTEITRAEDSYEVVMVLDNTGSMAGNKMSALKEASELLVNNLFGETAVHPLLDMAVVPFAHAVNVGTDNKNANWMDKNALNPLHAELFDSDFTNQGLTRFDLYDRIKDVSWPGCVEARKYPLDVNDTEASDANPDTLFVPYFYPDEPGNAGSPLNNYYLSYLDDDTERKDRNNKEKRQMKTSKYKPNSKAEDGDWQNGFGPAYGCTAKPILPLTNKKADVLASLQGMQANGYTNITEGLMWGLRVISPKAPFSEGKAFGTDDHHKIIILLTDGRNQYPNTPNSQNHNKSQYGPYGFMASKRLVDSNNLNTIENKMNQRTAEACQAVKSEDILLFTITFQVGDTTTENLMRNCATEPDMYYDSPSTSTLKGVFHSIATRISELRISK